MWYGGPEASCGWERNLQIYVISQVCSPPATIAMENIQLALGSAISRLSDERYEQSLDYFRLWFKIGQRYSQNPSDLIFDAIYVYRTKGSWNDSTNVLKGYLIGHLVPRFVDDVESDPSFAPYSAGLRNRFSTRILQEFFDGDLEEMNNNHSWAANKFYVDVNLIAHCANLGYIEEDMIRDYILQSLISHPKLHDHQADALATLFKIAGATFGAYVDPAIVDRCFQLLKNHNYKDKGYGRPELIEVGTFSVQQH